MSSNKLPYVARGNQRYQVLVSKTTFNVDVGAGTTTDECLIAGLPTAAHVVAAYPVYTEATDTAGAASANWKLGVAAGGATIVAATALEAAKAVGDYGTAQKGLIPLPALGSLFIRHTGVASTEGGEYFLVVILLLEP